MKRIVLRAGGEHGSLSVLRLVAGHSPQRAITIEEIRRRVRILDALDAADAELLLEDADAEVLVRALEGFPWNMASRELLEIIDDVLTAEEVKG